MSIRLNPAVVSDIGPHRASNQDAAFTASWGAAVADGVGGGPSGDLASAALVHRLVPGPMRITEPEELLARIREANWDLRAHVRRDPSLQGMATTFTGIFVTPDDRLLLAHTGDSRAYVLRHAQLLRQTRDDSYVQALVDSGLLAPEAAASHPRRNIITASLGGGEEDVVSVAEREAVVGDRWLLCSDGVSDYLDDEEIGLTLLRHRDVGSAAEALVALALDSGSRDNVTAVICDVVDGLADLHERAAFAGSAAERFQEQLDVIA
ncbi:protein phosphatase 2C domain-containing protein [Microbacterium sp. cx-55]|uniref:PP2C family protein-serine/threonine phosphatase n=1 Tax=Microbacterium sp. cx-55 TaxID=2875948 RepID=UPI001CBC0CA3|nr:protein phosphatase 2C domain-containing protein [Microbacterium sp. cx-55]MBZ4486620.1 protein phosphatase 2C domain-containing protein [Microbacterium sp. cx-55]UGB36414.1 protein phosphatase 2C domain-containing protein [Microbacterium sp. cx-55]